MSALNPPLPHPTVHRTAVTLKFFLTSRHFLKSRFGLHFGRMVTFASLWRVRSPLPIPSLAGPLTPHYFPVKQSFKSRTHSPHSPSLPACLGPFTCDVRKNLRFFGPPPRGPLVTVPLIQHISLLLSQFPPPFSVRTSYVNGPCPILAQSVWCSSFLFLPRSIDQLRPPEARKRKEERAFFFPFSSLTMKRNGKKSIQGLVSPLQGYSAASYHVIFHCSVICGLKDIPSEVSRRKLQCGRSRFLADFRRLQHFQWAGFSGFTAKAERM